MSYPSVDKLQQTLASTVFRHATDKKKAAGRALGTLVEIVTFYTLRTWGLRDHVVIERALAEYANPQITHNVEFSLHPVLDRESLSLKKARLPITPTKLRPDSKLLCAMAEDRINKSNQLVTSRDTKRNACVVGEDAVGPVVANVDSHTPIATDLTLCRLHRQPFAVFECKRVGVEEGMKKGPQTIEKAKQGAYVARAVSALQKVRARDGGLRGYIEQANGNVLSGPFTDLMKKVISSNQPDLLSNFILTVGMVSNHGNWFTSENHNKELKVLAQSYDWLLFLTDQGLSQFIDKLLLHPKAELTAAREAFLTSYGKTKSGPNRFTKIQMGNAADAALSEYFRGHEDEIEGWFNVIAPNKGSITELRDELHSLGSKNWKKVHDL